MQPSASSAPPAPALSELRLADQPARDRLILATLASAMAANLVVVTLLPALSDAVSAVAAAEAALFVSTLVAGCALLLVARRPDAWRAVRWLAAGLWASTVVQVVDWVARALWDRPAFGALLSVNVAAILAGMAAVAAIDVLDHIREQRGEVIADVAMLSTLTGAAAYILLQPGGTPGDSGAALAVTVLIGIGAVAVIAAWVVLCLWCPTRVHAGLLACCTTLAVAGVVMDRMTRLGWNELAGGLAETAIAAALLGMTALLVVEPNLFEGDPLPPRGKAWLRPSLLAISLGGACVIVVLATLVPDSWLGVGEGVALAAAVFLAVGIRMLVNQIGSERTARELVTAMREKDAAFASLREASESVAASEARLRLLLGAAVDGIVELDGLGVVVRANRAFCAMVRLAEKDVVGRRWQEMVARAGAGASLADLPQTGEAVLVLPGGTSYLEARTSRLTGTPPGTLLLIRDVTANKASEQTIRTLLHFLQDRDEDRSRLLKRSNAAIEAERNRIARDLHDGPIQGISASALSLEALRLMLAAGDHERAEATLKEIAAELGEEAMNLRRVMSDLRPPVLEERGLIPAVRELCSRLQRETRIRVELTGTTGSSTTAGPRDVETLAYRVVQEALSNVSKHSGATRVTVRVEVTSGTLEVSVSDNGWGFDPTAAREFLRTGKVGLASMRERTELAGGSLSIRSTPGSGTVVMASIPFDVLTPMGQFGELDDAVPGLAYSPPVVEESLAVFSARIEEEDGPELHPPPRPPRRRRTRRATMAPPPASSDDGDGDGEGLGEGEGVGLGDGLGEGEGLGVGDGDGLGEGLGDGLGDDVVASSGTTS